MNTDTIVMKTCIRCNEIKNTEEFYVDRSRRDGFNSYCKSCKSTSDKQRRTSESKQYMLAKKEARDNLLIAGKKVCSQCGETKSLEEFWKQEDKKDGLRSNCKTCTSKYQKQHYADHKDTINAKQKEYYARNGALFPMKVHEYFGGRCYICGEDANFTPMYHGHHIDPLGLTNPALKKICGIAMMRDKDWDTEVVPEMEKCVYVCANCHAKLTHGWFDDDIASGKLVLIPGKQGVNHGR